jgi:FkbM family methyltransferase
MKLKSYAQHGEDDLIWKFFDKKKTGLIIEVGAFDGKYLSNSCALDRLGWKTICVEPLPFYYDLLHKNRPNAININAAVVANENISVVNMNEDTFGVYSSIETIDNITLKNAFNNANIPYKKPKKIQVKGITLNKILTINSIKSDSIDCLSIDVEGLELEVLKSIDLKYYRPKLLVVEANNEDKLEMIKKYLNELGYFMAIKKNINFFFVIDNHLITKLQSVNIDCNAVVLRHPKGLLYSEQSPYLSKWKLFIIKVIKKILKINNSLYRKSN